jgi:hypothetical protein
VSANTTPVVQSPVLPSSAPVKWGSHAMPAPVWVDTSLFVPFTRVLWHILLQTADSMQCAQFELRRISAMVI